MTETKYIPFSELKVGMEIEGWKKGSSTCFSSKEIKNIKNNTISFNWGDPLKNLSSIILFWFWMIVFKGENNGRL